MARAAPRDTQGERRRHRQRWAAHKEGSARVPAGDAPRVCPRNTTAVADGVGGGDERRRRHPKRVSGLAGVRLADEQRGRLAPLIDLLADEAFPTAIGPTALIAHGGLATAAAGVHADAAADDDAARADAAAEADAAEADADAADADADAASARADAADDAQFAVA